jgi:curli biogenesis system outer membrane secretion channel CsgG
MYYGTRGFKEMMGRITLLLVALAVAGCGQQSDDDNAELLASNKTLAVGKFQLSGSAQSGQYARQLFKVDRFLAQELARAKGWQLVESARIGELLNEFEYVPDEPSAMDGRMDRLLDGMVDKLVGEESEPTQTPAEPTIDNPADQLPKADYLLVGEMDGFDVYFDESAQTINGTVRTLQNRARRARTRLSFRVIDVRNRTWLLSHSRSIEVILPDERNAESQIDLALSAMVKEAVATIGMEETLPVRSATAPRDEETATAGATSALAATPVKVAFGGFNIFHPDVDADIGHATQADAQLINSLAATGLIRMKDLLGIASVTSELEAMISHRLKTASGLKVMEQNSGRVKALLAQQVLTDLSKGRQPGLPMGSIQGADYLVFGIIHDMSIETSKPQFVEGVAMSMGGKPRTGTSRLHLYMQDVNTGEHVLSEEVNVEKSLKGIKRVEEGVSALLTHIADESIKRFLVSLRPPEIFWVGPGGLLINHGEMAGLQIGDELPVYSKGENAIDPYTGAVMKGVGSTQVGLIKVSGFNAAGWAEATIIEGSGFHPGQPVKLAAKPSAAEIRAAEEKPAMMTPKW